MAPRGRTWSDGIVSTRNVIAPRALAGFEARVRKGAKRPVPKLRHENPMVSADAFWSRAHDHEPHGGRATGRDAHRLLRRALDLTHARKIFHAET